MLDEVDNAQHRAAYWLMYGCGLRPGETYNLTIDRINLENRRVVIANRAAASELPPFTVKADGQSSDGKERSVPIPEAAISDLTETVRRSFKSGGLVCLTAKRYSIVRRNWNLCMEGRGWAGHGHRPWQNRDMVNNLRRDTKKYLRKAGIELSAPFTLTTFRKSFAQNHADAGTPPRTLAKLLGHADARMTTQYYNRVTDANEQAAAQTMDRLLKQDKRSRGVG
jgi:integrase